METKLSPHLCGFRSGYSTQHALSNLLFNWLNCLDKFGVVSIILMDFSKAFDCLPHNLIVAKMQTYGLHHDSLRLIRKFLSNRHQKKKLDSIFSSLMQTIIGVPQGSTLGPLLFLNDLLLINFRSKACNFADDNTLYYSGGNTENIIKHLQSDLKILSKWFRNNKMMANSGEILYMSLGKHKPLKIEIEGFQLESAKSVSLLGITIDQDLTFDRHMSNISKTARAKVKSLNRIRNALDEKQAKLLYNPFILSHFN